MDTYVNSSQGLTGAYCYSEWVGVDGRIQTKTGEYSAKAVGYYWTGTQTTKHVAKGIKDSFNNTYTVVGIN